MRLFFIFQQIIQIAGTRRDVRRWLIQSQERRPADGRLIVRSRWRCRTAWNRRWKWPGRSRNSLSRPRRWRRRGWRSRRRRGQQRRPAHSAEAIRLRIVISATYAAQHSSWNQPSEISPPPIDYDIPPLDAALPHRVNHSLKAGVECRAGVNLGPATIDKPRSHNHGRPT